MGEVIDGIDGEGDAKIVNVSGIGEDPPEEIADLFPGTDSCFVEALDDLESRGEVSTVEWPRVHYPVTDHGETFELWRDVLDVRCDAGGEEIAVTVYEFEMISEIHVWEEIVDRRR